MRRQPSCGRAVCPALTVIGAHGATPFASRIDKAEMAARLSWLAYDLRDEIAELDLNPVIILPKGQGAFAVDALVVMR